MNREFHTSARNCDGARRYAKRSEKGKRKRAGDNKFANGEEIERNGR